MNAIKNIIRKAALLCSLPLWGALAWGLCLFSSCVETDSNLVEYVDKNTLDSPNDTVYSLVGIIGKMQAIADRTILLGELRGDLCALNSNADLDLQDIANFNVGSNNPYNNARDYYAIIQNCNFFIAHADTTLSKRGEKVFERELAAVRTYRAWTYMQLALNYGSVPFFTEPILTELDGNPDLYPKYDIKQIADHFIPELEPLVDTRYPEYGSMGNISSTKFFIPVRVLLGELCLWSGRYEEACKHYYNFLTVSTNPRPINRYDVTWGSRTFENIVNSYTTQYSSSASSTITVIPMHTDEYDGTVSYLDDIFSSTEDNNYYYQASASRSYQELSMSQRYTLVGIDPATNLRDTIYPTENQYYEQETYRGDLRYSTLFTLRANNMSSDYYSPMRQSISKYNTNSNYVAIYRLPFIYLHFAEALNRAGLPEMAFTILKYGLSTDTMIFPDKNGEITNVLSQNTYRKLEEIQQRIGVTLNNFNQYQFDNTNTMGIHARGCGSVNCDSLYIIPELPTLSDSITFVEDLLCDEMALELSFEGCRFYDLIRISYHRNDPTFLANKVALRNGTAQRNETLYALLSDEKNWYLKLE